MRISQNTEIENGICSITWDLSHLASDTQNLNLEIRNAKVFSNFISNYKMTITLSLSEEYRTQQDYLLYELVKVIGSVYGNETNVTLSLCLRFTPKEYFSIRMLNILKIVLKQKYNEQIEVTFILKILAFSYEFSSFDRKLLNFINSLLPKKGIEANQEEKNKDEKKDTEQNNNNGYEVQLKTKIIKDKRIIVTLAEKKLTFYKTQTNDLLYFRSRRVERSEGLKKRKRGLNEEVSIPEAADVRRHICSIMKLKDETYHTIPKPSKISMSEENGKTYYSFFISRKVFDAFMKEKEFPKIQMIEEFITNQQPLKADAPLSSSSFHP